MSCINFQQYFPQDVTHNLPFISSFRFQRQLYYCCQRPVIYIFMKLLLSQELYNPHEKKTSVSVSTTPQAQRSVLAEYSPMPSAKVLAPIQNLAITIAKCFGTRQHMALMIFKLCLVTARSEVYYCPSTRVAATRTSLLFMCYCCAHAVHNVLQSDIISWMGHARYTSSQSKLCKRNGFLRNKRW